MSLLETFFNWNVLVQALPQLFAGLLVTLELGLLSILLGLLGGLLLCLLRLYGANSVRWLCGLYIDIFRSIPMLVLLILVYYALPFVGIRLSSFWAATATLSMVSCAYTAEIFRAGLQAIPAGQREASDALGLGFVDTLRDVLLPQAIRIVIPPMTSNCINVLKDTALASVVAMPDLLKQATQAQALAANPTPLIGAALLYLLLLLPLVRMVGAFETRNPIGKR
jgi:polar amino acid transport system permease protein|uniref:ABC-type amino acid transport system, permease component n=1 Tax=Polaromonas sp. E10S TaxID=1840239 RepID=A0A2S1FHQ5_9BURK|nr:amino acid ABC transporter permease [Polaromonas sp. E10S]AWD71992.1 ABC-type amino acid transport system, permease component [Polaromonas sp. E10S]